MIALAESGRAPARQHRQPRRVHAARAGRDGHRGDAARARRSSTRRCPRTIPKCASRTSRSRASCSGWEPEVELRDGLRRTIEQAGVEASRADRAHSGAAAIRARSTVRETPRTSEHLSSPVVYAWTCPQPRLDRQETAHSATPDGRVPSLAEGDRDMRAKRPPVLAFLLRLGDAAADRARHLAAGARPRRGLAGDLHRAGAQGGRCARLRRRRGLARRRKDDRRLRLPGHRAAVRAIGALRRPRRAARAGAHRRVAVPGGGGRADLRGGQRRRSSRATTSSTARCSSPCSTSRRCASSTSA